MPEIDFKQNLKAVYLRMTINKKKRLINEISILLKRKGVTEPNVSLTYFKVQNVDWLNKFLVTLRWSSIPNLIDGILVLGLNIGAIPNNEFSETNEQLLKEFFRKRGIITSKGEMISNINLQVVDLSQQLKDLKWLDLYLVLDRLANLFRENAARLN